MAQTVKNPHAMWEARFRSLGREDPLEKEMATHFSILAWKIPWMEEPGRLQSMVSQRVRHDCATNDAHFNPILVLAMLPLPLGKGFERVYRLQGGTGMLQSHLF